MNNTINRPTQSSEPGKRLSADTGEKTRNTPKAAPDENLPKQQPASKSLSPQALSTLLAKQSDKVTATVVSSTPLSNKALAILAKVNPELARTVEQLQSKALAKPAIGPGEPLKSPIANNIPNNIAGNVSSQIANQSQAAPKAQLTAAMVNKIVNDASNPLLATNNTKVNINNLASSNSASALLINNKAELSAALVTQLKGSQGVISPQNIGDKPTLFAVKLLVGQQSLLTISPTPLAKDTSLMLSASSIQNMSPTLTESKANLNSAQPLVLKANSESVTATQTTVSSIIRQALPQENSSREILSLLNQFEKISPSIKNVLVPETINKLTSAIIDSSLDTKQPISQQQLKDSLLNSGLFVENKLAQTNTPPLLNDRRVILEKLISLLQSNGPTNPLAPASSHLSALASEKIAELLASINQQPANTITHGQPQKPDSFLWLLNALGLKLPSGTPGQSEQLLASLSQKLQQKMSHLAQANLAKIQLDQIKSLGLDKPGGDPISSSLTVELPLRWLDQVLPLTLHISQREEHADEKEESNDKENTEKVKQWQVMMSFDLPGDQRLHVQLSLVEQQCSALLWAESPQLRQTASNHLSTLTHKLEAIGLTVDAIECFEGKPQAQQSPLGYQLVDIKT